MNALSANPTVLGVRFYDAEGRIIADGDQQQPLFQLQPDAAGQRYAASDLTIFAWGGGPAGSQPRGDRGQPAAGRDQFGPVHGDD